MKLQAYHSYRGTVRSVPFEQHHDRLRRCREDGDVTECVEFPRMSWFLLAFDGFEALPTFRCDDVSGAQVAAAS